MSKVEELKRIIKILDQEGVDKCEKLEAQAKRIKELEKALDKVCDLIGDYTDCPLEIYEKQYPFCKGWECDNHGARCWKEWAMMEVQEDE